MKWVNHIENRVNIKMCYCHHYGPEGVKVKDDDEINYTYFYCVEVSNYKIFPLWYGEKSFTTSGIYAIFKLSAEK